MGALHYVDSAAASWLATEDSCATPRAAQLAPADSAGTPPGAPARWLRPPPQEGREGREASSAVDPGDWCDSPRSRAVERTQWLDALRQRVAARRALAGPPAQPPSQQPRSAAPAAAGIPSAQRFHAQIRDAVL
eukprot:SM000112S23957  [mRNA]  locus=s112:55686:56307:+ [translate_table: standard]